MGKKRERFDAFPISYRWTLVKFGIGSLTPNYHEFLMRAERMELKNCLTQKINNKRTSNARACETQKTASEGERGEQQCT